MRKNNINYKRETIRLKLYDYSSEGLYFITMCVKNKLCLFGEIKNNKNILFDSGKMVEKYWLDIENKFDNIILHEYVIMPNHFHGIIEIKYKSDRMGCMGLGCTGLGCTGEPCVRPNNDSPK